MANDITTIDNGSCEVNPSWKSASAVAGNIGIVKARVMVWDHDPFEARATQVTSLPMSGMAAQRIDPSISQNVMFEAGAAMLKPEFKPDHMLVFAEKRDSSGENPEFDMAKTGNPEFDNPSGKGRYLWQHVGSLFTSDIVIYPSEYEAQNWEAIAKSRMYELKDALSAPKWDYTQIRENNIDAYCPVMKAKQVANYEAPIHWTLERYHDIWQGMDFWITVELRGKQPDETSNPINQKELAEITPQDDFRKEYLYLMAFLGNQPKDEAWGLKGNTWINGVSNAPYYTSPDNEQEQGKRFGFWENNFKYKSYILVEVGVGNMAGRREWGGACNHYFIELVKGKNPRFIYLGPSFSTQAGKVIMASRVLGEFPISVNDLFSNKNRIKFLVRNHLGRIVITFEGHEDQPWVITRTDYRDQASGSDASFVPIVIPPGRIRIHGGNISCLLNFSVAQYVPSGYIPFTGTRSIQADTHNAKNKDLYMIFSQPGNLPKYENNRIQRMFSDKRFLGQKFGYECDAYQTTEIFQNSPRVMDLYQSLPKQFMIYGKGYILSSNGLELGAITKHQIKIMPLNESGKTITNSFSFGLSDDNAKDYPYKDYVSEWQFQIEFLAGSIDVYTSSDKKSQYSGYDENDDMVNYDTYENAMTPILTGVNVWILGGEKSFEGKVEPFDISTLVTKMTDSWKSEDYSYINHEMQLSCYLPMGPSVGDNDEIFALAKKLYALHDKFFYLSVSYYWDSGIGERTTPAFPIALDPETQPEPFIQMTGIASSCKFNRSANQLMMEISVKDYSYVLDKQQIFNSPFFDAVSDVEAVLALGKMAGFDSSTEQTGRSYVNRKPLAYLSKVVKDPSKMVYYHNGEKVVTRPYDLPGQYAVIFATGNQRAQEGESYLSYIKKIANYGKTIYFDRWGVLKMENSPAKEVAFTGQTTEDPTAPYSKYLDISSKFDFFSSPHHPDFDPDIHASHLLYISMDFQRLMEDCVNHITLMTASPDVKKDKDGKPMGGLIVEGYTFFEQIFDPTSEGFIGFRKPYVQTSGLMGGRAELRKTMQHYAKQKYPISIITIQTFGVPGLKPLDIITVDGNKFYITDISHDIEPKENRWWMNITAEWLKPFTGFLGQLDSEESSITLP
jgi:hypothetical protein